MARNEASSTTVYVGGRVEGEWGRMEEGEMGRNERADVYLGRG